VIYLDSSALIKLVRPENETAALEQYLHAHRARPHVASELVVTEVRRALHRRQAPDEQFQTANTLLERLILLPVNRLVLEHAAAIADRHLRSLDAIHLASAQRLRSSLTVLITYDVRMTVAAAGSDVPTDAPE
jgi:uncharacterized protein